MSSINPISSGGLSAIVQEIETATGSQFGANPFTYTPPADEVGATAPSRWIYNILVKLRDQIAPDTIYAANSQKITIVYRSIVVTAEDPLNARPLSDPLDVYAIVMGATLENIQAGLIAAADLECVVAANALTTPLSENDAIVVDGTRYDIVAIRAYPVVPFPVAYRFMLRKART